MSARLALCLSGGALGRDPMDARAWSGSARRLAEALPPHAELAEAFGLSLPAWRFAALSAPRWAADREVWRRRVYRSAAYREALTRQLAGRGAAPCDAVLQIGAYADGPAALPGLPVLTYQDGAAATYAGSGFAPRALTEDAALTDAALAFEARVARGAARVLTTSDWLAREMTAAYGLPPGHAVSVGCGVVPVAPSSDAPKDYASQRVLFVGKEWARKGGPLLLEAFAAVRTRLPKARLDVVGPLERPAGTDAPGVTWHGFLSRSDEAEAARLDALFASASLFVLPSLYEPFGIAPIEAMSAGVPALVTGEWAMAETVRDGVDGAHVPRGDGAALARSMSDLLAAPDTLSRLGAGARTRASAFTWDAVARRIAAQAEEASAAKAA